MWQATSWSPVPEAAAMPIRPRGTALAKPSGTPPTIAVPQSGPIRNRPRARAYDTSHRLHVVRETHQRDGVLVEAPPDEIPRGHHRSGARAHLGGVMPYALIFR